MKKDQGVPHYSFQYVRFHGKHYPLIPITLRNGRYKVKTFALIDSGASISVFRPEISKALHLPIKTKNNLHLGTANGGVDIKVAKVEVQVERTRFKSKIGFSTNFATSFNILGREGFFHKFSVCFNEMMKTVIMVPLEDLP